MKTDSIAINTIANQIGPPLTVWMLMQSQYKPETNNTRPKQKKHWATILGGCVKHMMNKNPIETAAKMETPKGAKAKRNKAPATEDNK